MHGDASNFFQSASKSDWYFILKFAIYLENVYMQTHMNVKNSAIKKIDFEPQ